MISIVIGMESMKDWSVYIRLFSGKLLSSHRCDVMCAIPVYELYNIYFSKGCSHCKNQG